ATWRLNRDELKSLVQARGATRFRAVQSWRARRRLPRWIALADADNQLPIDLDNILAVDTLLELVREREQAILVELFPGPAKLCARGPEGRFVHELVVPFVRAKGPGAAGDKEKGKRTALPNAPETSPPSLPSLQRRFPPGSQWLYANLYTGPATIDL